MRKLIRTAALLALAAALSGCQLKLDQSKQTKVLETTRKERVADMIRQIDASPEYNAVQKREIEANIRKHPDGTGNGDKVIYHHGRLMVSWLITIDCPEETLPFYWVEPSKCQACAVPTPPPEQPAPQTPPAHKHRIVLGENSDCFGYRFTGKKGYETTQPVTEVEVGFYSHDNGLNNAGCPVHVVDLNTGKRIHFDTGCSFCKFGEIQYYWSPDAWKQHADVVYTAYCPTKHTCVLYVSKETARVSSTLWCFLAASSYHDDDLKGSPAYGIMFGGYPDWTTVADTQPDVARGSYHRTLYPRTELYKPGEVKYYPYR